MVKKAVAVDDDAIAREYMGFLLREAGYENVALYASPQEALLDLRRRLVPPDLIVLDIAMPEMDGIELCSQIRTFRRLSSSKILMVTSARSPTIRGAAIDAGATYFVSKYPSLRTMLKQIVAVSQGRAVESASPAPEGPTPDPLPKPGNVALLRSARPPSPSYPRPN